MRVRSSLCALALVTSTAGISVFGEACGSSSPSGVAQEDSGAEDAGADGSGTDAGDLGSQDSGSSAADSGAKDAPADGDAGCETPACTSGPEIVLFGGSNSSGLLNDTWTWDGSNWNATNAASRPKAREGEAMATLGGKPVLFGGLDITGGSNVSLNDTWTWDGVTWTLVSPSGAPPGRSGHAMATLGGKIVLFGGGPWGTVRYADTWTWDGVSWTQMNVAGPPGRASHAMATLGTKIVLFGGVSSGADLNDTWVWDGAAWTQMSVANPPPAREGHAMATVAGKVVLFGGLVRVPNNPDVFLNDTWTWDGATWTLETVASSPTPRFGNAMVTFQGKAVLLGGGAGSSNPTIYHDMWSWDGATWSQAPANAAQPMGAFVITPVP